MSKIEWTEKTWNPIVGCSIVSPGCTNCYAMRMARRLEFMDVPHYVDTTKVVNGNAAWTGNVMLAPEHILIEPLRRKKPTMYFVNSMGDLFHEDVPDEWISKVVAVMAICPQHTFQVLTKRSKRLREYVGSVTGHSIQHAWADISSEYSGDRDEAIAKASIDGIALPLPNVWLGVSAERQQEADERIPDLLATPAAIRFVSAEPLLGPIDFTYIKGQSWPDAVTNALRGYTTAGFTKPDEPSQRITHARLDQIIVGGESGHGARPMHPDWARSIRDQCQAAGTAFFFKQWGEFEPVGDADNVSTIAKVLQLETDNIGIAEPNGRWTSGADLDFGAVDRPGWVMARVGKKRAGRLLDGRTWDEMPIQNVRLEAAE